MSSFIHKKLSSDKSVAEIIKEERQKRNLSLSEVSLKTQIALDYLNKLEQGRYHQLPGDIYIKQFVKKLAKYFNFSEKNLLAIYQKEKINQLNIFQSTPLKLSKRPQKNLLSFLTPRLIRLSLVSLIILGLFGYLALEITNIFTPPLLEIESPAAQTITVKPAITIKGKTMPEALILINQQEILTKPDGSFSQDVNLNMGLNLFEISASKKHSKENIITISILRQPATTSDLNMFDRSVSFQ
ncbi:helix-turn-helix domain-containing protein [Patescibacteria group bacterium]|nr:helix-turn-helix domain-containing protein [Patescibacteria group bacterium]